MPTPPLIQPASSAEPHERQRHRFEVIIRSDPDLMRLLTQLREIRLPQWRLVAGCLYQTVWNVLTGRPRGTGIQDYDLIYFASDDLSWEAEDAVIRRVAAATLGCVGPVEVRNQARVHLWSSVALGLHTRSFPPRTRRCNVTLRWFMRLAFGSSPITGSI